MVLMRVIQQYPVVAFVGLALAGIVSAGIGAHLCQRRQGAVSHADDGLIIDGVITPILGLFALIVAFTFSQALSLESATYADVIATRFAIQHSSAAVAVLADADRGTLAPRLSAYVERYDNAVRSNSVANDDTLMRMEMEIQRDVAAADFPTKNTVQDSLNMLFAAVRQLRVDTARRVPTTVFALQSLYYFVAFFILGYKSAEHGLYAGGRIFVCSLACLFAVVMFMAMNVGRPGIHAMLFDAIPELTR